MVRNYSLLAAHGGINIANARISSMKRTLGSSVFSLILGVWKDRNVECENVYYNYVSAKCFACGLVHAILLLDFGLRLFMYTEYELWEAAPNGPIDF